MARVALGRIGDELVPNDRLEKVFYQLQRLVDFPDGLTFATQRQEPTPDQEALAVFMVISPHPLEKKTALHPSKIISLAQMPFDKWTQANKEYRHYAFLTDPLRPIFAGLLRNHLRKYKDAESLKESTFAKG